MVVRYLPVLSNICVSSFCVCIVFTVVAMSLSGLHSLIDIWVCGIIVGGGMNLVSLVYVGVRCVFAMCWCLV